MFLWNPQECLILFNSIITIFCKRKYYLFILVFLTCWYNKYWNQDMVNLSVVLVSLPFKWVGCWTLAIPHPLPLRRGGGVFSLKNSPKGHPLLFGVPLGGIVDFPFCSSDCGICCPVSHWQAPKHSANQVYPLDQLFGVNIEFWYKISTMFLWMYRCLKRRPIVQLDTVPSASEHFLKYSLDYIRYVQICVWLLQVCISNRRKEWREEERERIILIGVLIQRKAFHRMGFLRSGTEPGSLALCLCTQVFLTG